MLDMTGLGSMEFDRLREDMVKLRANLSEAARPKS
jgi:hypothetical protein